MLPLRLRLERLACDTWDGLLFARRGRGAGSGIVMCMAKHGAGAALQLALALLSHGRLRALSLLCCDMVATGHVTQAADLLARLAG